MQIYQWHQVKRLAGYTALVAQATQHLLFLSLLLLQGVSRKAY
jgi:hypothetical protein